MDKTLTAALLQHVTVAPCHRREHERMVVLGHGVGAVLGIVDALPRVLLDVDVRLGHVPVLVEEVPHQQQGELLRTADTVLLGQQIDGVLLRIGGNDIGIVTCAGAKGGGGERCAKAIVRNQCRRRASVVSEWIYLLYNCRTVCYK